MLPPVDDLRQAAFFLPYALLRTNADSALAAKARHISRLIAFCAPCAHVHLTSFTERQCVSSNLQCSQHCLSGKANVHAML